MPLYPPLPELATQTIYTKLATDTTTTSTTFVNLLTQDITIQEGSYLLIRSSFSTSDSVSLSTQNYFQVTVDGVVYVTGGAEIFTCIQSGSMVCKVGPLTAGVHQVNLDWRTSTGNTLRCRPLTQVESATMVITEVTDREVD